LDSEDITIQTVFRLRLLTAQRGGEVLGATWDEMDLTSGWWTIAAERSKNGLSHRVPLSPQALKALKSLRSETGDSPWVFPSPKKKDASIAHAQKAIERVVERSGVDFRGHDLRRTAASLMIGAGVPRLVVSKILNHAETGVTASTIGTATIAKNWRRSTFGGSGSSRSSLANVGPSYWRLSPADSGQLGKQSPPATLRWPDTKRCSSLKCMTAGCE
jgi:integrase